MGLDDDVGVEVGDAVLRGFDLGASDVAGAVDDLALEVGAVDDVEVDDAEGADAGGGEVDEHGRAEPARADGEHFAVDQLALPEGADLVHDQVAGVALDHFGRHGRAAGERGDHGHFIAVADQGVGALQGADFLAVEIDVDVLEQLLLAVEDHFAEAGVALVEVAQHAVDIAAAGLDEGAVAGDLAEGGGNVDLDGHGAFLRCWAQSLSSGMLR